MSHFKKVCKIVVMFTLWTIVSLFFVACETALAFVGAVFDCAETFDAWLDEI